MHGYAGQTIPSLLLARAAQQPTRPAIHVPAAGGYQAVDWGQLVNDVKRTAVALTELGVSPGDRVVLVSPNRYEWITTDLGIHLAGAVHVPVHVSLSGAQIAYQINDSGARLVILAGEEQAGKLRQYVEAHGERSADALAGVAVYSFDYCGAPIGLAEIHLFAHAVARASEATLNVLGEAAMKFVGPDTLATILYTSGTTGEPKGVMLSQRNLASNALATLATFGQTDDDLRLNWLPLSHIFARTCDLYTWIASGCELALSEGADRVIANCFALSPTLINGVPYFFEKVQRHLIETSQADDPQSLRQLFGGRLRAACSGGAPLPDHVAQFYCDRGVLLVQGYGLTESSPVITAGTTGAWKLGAVGRPIPGVEVRISDDGEILTRGPHVMLGYWNRPQATAEAFCDDWLRTGDLGEIDDEGYLRITGRKKDLIVTSAGKNIAPSHLEALLTADPLIQQAVVIGDRRSCLAALIVPEASELATELRRMRIDGVDPNQALADPRVLALFEQRIAARLTDVSHHEQIRRFTLLDRPLSIERGELTLTLKLRRQAIQANFAEEIEAMYKAG